MPEPSFETLRQQLRERGYLSRGIERWFSLDPWKSRTFWSELLVVALKAGVLAGTAAGVFLTTVMLLRNRPSAAIEGAVLFPLYGITSTILAMFIVMFMALLLKSRPALAIDRPTGLLAIALTSSAIFVAPLIAWWRHFEGTSENQELVLGAALLATTFIIAVVAISAALLSFSIYELRRIPAIHRSSRILPLAVGALAVALIAAVASRGSGPRDAASPLQVVVSQSKTRIALIAVDGLSEELLRARPSLTSAFAKTWPLPRLGGSTAERWATIGTGVQPATHGVHAIEGFRIRSSPNVLQAVSSLDVVLRSAAQAGIITRQPMPPSVRRRDFLWEIAGARGVTATDVNWWTASGQIAGASRSFSQSSIFSASGGDPLRVDALAAARLRDEIRQHQPRLITVYLPALDIILNRGTADRSMQFASSARALEGLEALVRETAASGYSILLVGMPGDSQLGHAVVATMSPMATPQSIYDVTPTICDLLGFPASREMPGKTLGNMRAERIDSYGLRRHDSTATAVTQEYYDSLKSLGYIR